MAINKGREHGISVLNPTLLRSTSRGVERSYLSFTYDSAPSLPSQKYEVYKVLADCKTVLGFQKRTLTLVRRHHERDVAYMREEVRDTSL